MKRFLAIFLLAAMVVSLTACSGGETISSSSENSRAAAPQSTAAQTTAAKETTEQITTLSEHPELIDVTGMTLDTAKTALENRGLNVTVTEEYSETVEKGYVISQIPKVENDLTLNQGDTVKLTVSLGKNENISYLCKMLYSDEKSDTKHNTFSVYDGEDYNGDVCENALMFTMSYNDDDYPEKVVEEGYANYSVSYDIDAKYKKFKCNLTHLNLDDDTKLEIYGDDKVLFSQGITNNTAKFEMELDVSNVKVFTIKTGTFIQNFGGDYFKNNIIFEEAYFE